MREVDHAFVPVGQGNVVSVEFNQLYRWHATLSAKDTEWTSAMFDSLLKGQDPAKVKKKGSFLSSYASSTLDRLLWNNLARKLV
jgi:hypothetical protein